MSQYYQTEKLTEFKDIETDNTNKKTILQKLWTLNKSQTIDDTTTIVSDINTENSTKISKQNDTKKINKSNSFNTKDEISITRDTLHSESNSISKDFDSDELQKSLETTTATPPSSNSKIEKYNIPNVVKQIYALKYLQRSADAGSSSSTSSLTPSTSSSREFWMPDDQVKECFDCNDKFTTFRRRHHCRVCGQIFCAKCSDHEIPAQIIWPNNTGNIRVCKFCHSLVDQLETGDVLNNGSSMNELMKRLSAGTSLNPNLNEKGLLFKEADTDDSLKTIELNKPINIINSGNSNNSKLNNPFDISENKDYFKPQENDIIKLISSNVSELRNLWVKIYHTSDGIPFQTRSINKFKKITNCITSTELIEWLMKSKSVSKDQAIVIGQALVHGKWLVCATNTSSSASLTQEHVFSDEFAYYKPGSAALSSNKGDHTIKKVTIDAEEGPEWIKELNKLVTTEEEAASSLGIDTSNPITLSPMSLLKYDTDLSAKLAKDRENSLRQAQSFYPLSVTTNSTSPSSTTSNMSPVKVPIPPSSPSSAHTPNENRKSAQENVQEMEYDAEMTSFSPTESLQLLYKRLQLELLKQLLVLHNLPFDWFDIIIELVWKAVDLVKPDVKHDNDHMDIRKYIKIKKLSVLTLMSSLLSSVLNHCHPLGGDSPQIVWRHSVETFGGSKKDCRIVNGIVFTKNVAHKNMKTEMKNPKILLLRSSIEYQRVEEKLCSLQPLLIAESQSLRNNCSKLLRLNPDILVVEKSVARIAQEFLLQAGVTLVLNVKSRVMDILCRFLQADPMYSIDDLVRKPRLGFCTKFHVDKYYSDNENELFKPLMYFEGTPTNLGCTILLSGASSDELDIIKSITNFMIYVSYNSKLEQSFLIDKFAFFSTKNTLYENLLATPEPELTTETVDEIVGKLIENIKNSSNKNKIFLTENIDEAILNDTVQNSKSIKFKILLDKLILSCSPFIKYTLPYLLSDIGLNKCSLRKFVSFNYLSYYNSKILLTLATQNENVNVFQHQKRNKNKDHKSSLLLSNAGGLDRYIENWPYVYEKRIKEPHAFLKLHLTKSLDDVETKKSYADYRSRGQRIVLNQIAKTNSVDVFDQNADNPNGENKEEDSNEDTSNRKRELYDCLDVIHRQHFAVLFYSQCDTSPIYPNICIKSRIIDINFYGENDMTLGSFLARNCFRNGYICTNELCNTPVLYHTRYFVHGDSQISIKMNIIPDETLVPLTQSMPVLQSQFNPNNTNTPIITSTNEKNEATGQAGAKKNIVYDDISIYMWSVCRICQKQSKKIAMSPHTWSFSLGKFLELTFYANYYKRLYTGANDYCSHSLFHQHDQYFRFKNIQTIFSYSKVRICQLDLPTLEGTIQPYLKTKYEYIDEIKDLSEKSLTLVSTLIERLNALKANNLHDKQIQKLDQYITQINTDMTLKHKIEVLNLLLTKSYDTRFQLNKQASSDVDDLTMGAKQQQQPVFTLTVNNDEIEGQKSSYDLNYNQIELHLIDLKKYIATIVQLWNNKMADFFKKSKYDDTVVLENTSDANADSRTMKMDTESSNKQFAKDDESTYEKQANYSDALDIPNSVNQTNEYGKSSESTPNLSQQLRVPSMEVGDDDHSKTPTISMKRIFANLIPSSLFPPLKLPFPEEEHYLLSGESYYYVNDKDLGSIVAFTLSCKEYKEFQNGQMKKQMQNNTVQGTSPHSANNVAMSGSTKRSAYLQTHASMQTKENYFGAINFVSEFDDVDPNNPTPSSARSQFTSDLHFNYQFQDLSTKFYCKVYYADLFYKLRKLLFQNDEEKYIHSLFRCMNWEAKGGKSNSQFRKTLDNRFVLKEMSRPEVQSFLDFAPKYVQYITSCIQNNKPTALTKIVGAYRLCLKNSTAKVVKIDVLVLENLFYSRKHTQVFDLKGSERNRLINTQGKQSEKELVLLDENFLRWSFDNPIYIKCHAKHVLMQAIEADAEFLSTQLVMDYSLLCGFDQVNNEVIVGIIDYVRTFTWDKKLETYIKTIGSQGKMPTIVSPDVYRTRFISAIERYFLEVPDHWYQDSSTQE